MSMKSSVKLVSNFFLNITQYLWLSGSRTHYLLVVNSDCDCGVLSVGILF